MNLIQGVVSFRQYTSSSDVKKSFGKKWKNIKEKETHALDKFLKYGNNVITFSYDSKLQDTNGSELWLLELKIFNE